MWGTAHGSARAALAIMLGATLGGCGVPQSRVTGLETTLASLRTRHDLALDEIGRLRNELAMLEQRLRPERPRRGSSAPRADVESPRLKVVKLHAPTGDDWGGGGAWEEDEGDDADAAPSGGKKSARASIKIYENAPAAIGGGGAPAIPVPDSSTVVAGGKPRWEDSGYPDPASVNEKLPVPGGKAAPIPATAKKPTAPSEDSTAADDDGTGTGDTSAAPAGDDRAQALFNKAYLSFTRLAYADAESGFRTFVSRYPTHPSADAATYWLGETLYARGAFEDALRHFRDIARFTKSTKAPYALLKTGYCYQALKDVARAREVLAEVIRRYPKTEAAKLATVRLTELLKG
jgi:tol-pal system protein YbgF